ncbi:MCP four helix bundle domain-containing protein, partial [Giesbergeria anulus]
MFRNIKIGTRLAIGFSAILALLIVVVSIGVSRINEINGDIRSLVRDDFPKTVIANEIIDALNVNARILRNIYIFKDSEMQKEIDLLPEKSRVITAGIEKLDKMIATDVGKISLQKVKDARVPYLAEVERYLSLIKSGQREEAAGMLSGTLRNTQDNYIAAVLSLVDGQSALIVQRGQAAENLAASAENLLLILTGVAAVLSAVLGWLITRSITEPTRQLMNHANEMAAGNFGNTVTLSQQDEVGILAQSLRTMQSAVQTMIADTALLSKAAVDGKLTTRADASQHQGDFRKIVQGVNDTLDAVIGPLNVAAKYVEQIAIGDIPKPITESYNGDFNTLKNNLNACIEATNQQAAAAQAISKGDLSVSIKVRSDNDIMAKSLVDVVQAVGALVADANMLSQSTLEGKLSVRADAAKHLGDFRKVIQGLNATLESVVVPVNEVMAVLG